MVKDATSSNSTIHMKPVFDIVSEPKAQTYIDLLNFAASRCESFSLVWRDQFRHENSALEIKHALKPFILSNVRTDEWPGTKLIGHEAIVRRYRVADESVKLLQAAGSLYSWLAATPSRRFNFLFVGRRGLAGID